MIVPNYMPDPLEVPRNVTEEPYWVRVAFVRRTTALFALSIGAICGLSMLHLPRIGIWASVLGFAGTLLGLEVWRIVTRGRAIEGKVSAALLPVVIFGAALCVRELEHHGWPMWQLLASCGCLVTYTFLCGRDYSFVGNFFLSLIGSSVIVAAGCSEMNASMLQAGFALATNTAFLFYVLYDLASLLSRRRVDEPIAAVTDVYRDVFNVFGYLIRVGRHWQRHRLLSLPNPIEIRWNRKA